MVYKKIVSHCLIIYDVPLDSQRGVSALIQSVMGLDESFINLDRDPAISCHNRSTLCNALIYRGSKTLEYTTGAVVGFLPSPYGAIAPCMGLILDLAQIGYGYFGLKRAQALANQNSDTGTVPKEPCILSVNKGRGLFNLGADVSFIISELGGNPFYLKTFGLSGFGFGLTAEGLSLFKYMNWGYHQHIALKETHVYRQGLLDHVHGVIQKIGSGEAVLALNNGHPIWEELEISDGDIKNALVTKLTALYRALYLLGSDRLGLLDELNDGIRKMSNKIVCNQEQAMVADLFMAIGRQHLCLFAVCSLIELAQVGSYIAVSSSLSALLVFFGLTLYMIGAIKRDCFDKRRYDQPLYRGGNISPNQLFLDRLRRDPLMLVKTIHVIVQKEQLYQERPLTRVLELLGLDTQRVLQDTHQGYLKERLYPSPLYSHSR